MKQVMSLHTRSLWNAFLAVSVTAAAIFIPLFIVVQDSFRGLSGPFDLVLTVVFGIDLFLNVRDWKSQRLGSLSNRPGAGWLLMDVVAVIPFFILTGVVSLQLLRLVKFARIVLLMQWWRRESVQNWNILRLSFFVYWLLLSIHWLTAGWLALHGHEEHEYHGSEYLRALYWCIQTLSSVGYGDVLPGRDVEYLYAIGVMLFGVAVFGYIVGNVASMLANIDPAKAHYLETMEKLAAFMKYRKIPENLQRRIRAYFQYLWEKGRGYDENSALSSLPPHLMSEVSLHLKRDIIEKAPFFHGASDHVVREIAMHMRPVTYMPGDYVFKAGDHGHEMYFVSHGRLEVISQDGQTVLTVLSDGDFFGEIALLQSRVRTATVRALDYCDLYTLEKSVLDHILETNADLASRVRQSIEERLRRGT